MTARRPRWRLHIIQESWAPGKRVLLKVSATNLGYVDGLKLYNHKLFTRIEETINKTYLKNIWISQKEILRNLFDKYPNWKSNIILLELKKPIIDLWGYYGIYPEIRKEGLYLSVPLNKL